MFHSFIAASVILLVLSAAITGRPPWKKPPPAKLGEETPPRIDTGGGIYVRGDVHIHHGDFVGRDQIEAEDTKPGEKDDPHPSG